MHPDEINQQQRLALFPSQVLESLLSISGCDSRLGLPPAAIFEGSKAVVTSIGSNTSASVEVIAAENDGSVDDNALVSTAENSACVEVIPAENDGSVDENVLVSTESAEEAEERARVLSDVADLKKLAAAYSHPEVGVTATDDLVFLIHGAEQQIVPTTSHANGRNYFNRASAPETKDKDKANKRARQHALVLADVEALKTAKNKYQQTLSESSQFRRERGVLPDHLHRYLDLNDEGKLYMIEREEITKDQAKELEDSVTKIAKYIRSTGGPTKEGQLEALDKYNAGGHSSHSQYRNVKKFLGM